MIAQAIERTIFTKVAPKTIHYIQPVPGHEAQGLVGSVYDQMRREFQLAPPITVHSPVPPLLAGVWSIVRESMVAGPVSRVAREAVIAAVSQLNTCPFCVDVHTTMLHGGAAHGAAQALGSGRPDEIDDPQLRSLATWAFATRSPSADILQHPPFSRQEAPEIIGSAVTFHYINRVVNVLLHESPFLVRSQRKGLKGLMRRLAGSIIAQRVMDLAPSQGASLQFLPEAPLPRDLAWAASNPAVAGAYARFAAVVEEAGRDALPDEVRALVRQSVDAWNGEDPGLSRRWVEEAVAELSESFRPAARLTLLTALASYQVDETLIRAFQMRHPGDHDLVAAVAWASFTAARRTGTWLAVPSGNRGRAAGSPSANPSSRTGAT